MPLRFEWKPLSCAWKRGPGIERDKCFTADAGANKKLL
jgi:hypothetical protein